MVRHSNASIGPTESRYSIAQYSASGLFRWVDNGFIADKQWLYKSAKTEDVKHEEAWKTRWHDGLKILSNISEFLK